MATDFTDLKEAIQEFENTLPDWWWSLGSCHVSRDASCGPQSIGCDAHLLEHKTFDNGFHHDNVGKEPISYSLRKVMQQSLEAKEIFNEE